ncbi:MAG TPA: FlgD immunoglobulin-like domain containing protein [Treponemataceae bacterium]|nr:FlgD immunoglobulin-like domain containing protein [Treponemataceae bacterium]
MTNRFTAFCAATLILCSGLGLFAYDPPVGGDNSLIFLSPALLGGGASATGGAFGGAGSVSVPGALAVNPALGADEQRIVFDASYIALYGAGDDDGLGHAANVGGLYPTRWGVLAGSIHFLTVPFDYSLPLGTMWSARASASKDLTDSLAIGVGLVASTGDGWGLAGDLGILYKAGDFGFLKNTRLGISITGLGRPFNPDTYGVKGGDSTGYPSMFTPRAGIAATLFSNKDFKVGASTDVSAPTFQNFILDLGLEANFREILTVRSGWNFNLLENAEDCASLLPSIAIGVNLKIKAPDDNTFLAKNGWSQSDVTPMLAVKPLYDDIYAVGGGINVHLGVTDNKAPAFAIEYPEPAYVSPNNDGTKDELTVPLTIDEQRYVTGWAFTIEDSSGTTVRTIENKEARPEMQSLKSFWTLLTRKKAGIEVPPAIRWDGTLDSGEIAPDGTYAFTIAAEDDNGNRGSSERYIVHVDRTAPSVAATAPSGANAMIFSPDGDGNKDLFTVAQKGSAEDLWTVTVLDASGKAIRTVETKASEPTSFSWDGKTDSGSVAPDGVYSYRIAARDRAGNSGEARVDNIILDTVKPAINVTIDTNAFSPNGDSAKDSILLTPSVPVVAGLVDWELAVVGRSNAPSRTYRGTGAVSPIAFDGKDDNGKALPEGDYQAVLSARYVNGHAPVSKSAFFALDVTKPDAQVRASGPIFSPVGDGKLDTVSFTQEASEEPSWTGEVFALDGRGQIAGKPIRSIELGSRPATKFVWDGRDESGAIAPDGKYGYRLSGTDRAGNIGYSNVAAVELNTEKADVILQASLAAFSPNGDGVKDAISFVPVIKASTPIDGYVLTIRDSAGKAVKTVKGSGKPPASIAWNGVADPTAGEAAGARCPDGTYGASLEVTLANQQTSRSAAPDFTIDTKAPTVEATAPYLVFSPNADGKRDALPIAQKSSSEERWTASIVSAKKQVVKTYSWTGSVKDFAWDATDDSGNRVADGAYTYSISTEDRAGNRAKGEIAGIVVDTRVAKAYLTAELAAFSPNGDGIKDSQRLAIVASIPDGLESWTVRVRPEAGGEPVRAWTSAEGQALPAAINWDGKTDSGELAIGRFVAELSLSYEKGDAVKAATAAFASSAKAPALSVKLAPKYFSPDNDGIEDELFINLAAQSDVPLASWTFEIRGPQGSTGDVFWKTGGADKIADRITWDGRSLKGELVQAATDYPFTFTVTDSVGQTSTVRGYVPVDVLVIRDGDRLKIAVPSIIFRENAADFNGLAAEVVDKNVQVLRRIAEILNKFRDYRIQVEGHANNVTGTQREEDAELIPLSRLRADAVKNFLVQNGVNADRLSTVGMGGTRPVAPRADRDNWWKNRRVEFILLK